MRFGYRGASIRPLEGRSAHEGAGEQCQDLPLPWPSGAGFAWGVGGLQTQGATSLGVLGLMQASVPLVFSETCESSVNVGKPGDST